MIEGAIVDTPVINAGLYWFQDTNRPAWWYESFTHVKRIMQTNATRNAHTMHDLLEYINSYLEDRSRDRDKRRDLVAQEVTTNPGTASVKIGEFLLNLVEARTAHR